MLKENFYILTGGPGAGKTAVIDGLRHAGYTTVRESGRDIIRQQVAGGGDALPWANRGAYARLMAERAVADCLHLRGTQQPVFFDRGLPDVTGYLHLCGLPIPADIAGVTEDLRYNATVFIAPPWEEIYRKDEERKQSFGEAVRTYEVLHETYMRMGYTLVVLPKVSAAARARFILQQLH
jgi:predicted ATPase